MVCQSSTNNTNIHKHNIMMYRHMSHSMHTQYIMNPVYCNLKIYNCNTTLLKMYYGLTTVNLLWFTTVKQCFFAEYLLCFTIVNTTVYHSIYYGLLQ